MRVAPARASYRGVRTAPLDVGPQPTYIGNDLGAIAEQLIERYPAGTAAGL
jgi:hypothetical protein